VNFRSFRSLLLRTPSPNLTPRPRLSHRRARLSHRRASRPPAPNAHLAPHIHLSLVSAGKPDGFRIHGQRGNIHVQAATVPTLLYGVSWYLKYVAHLNISTNGSQLGSPTLKLPAVATPIVKPALYPFRYALNENTDGYTTPYWDFPRFQHEIDILALSGLQRHPHPARQRPAVYQAFLDLGYLPPGHRQTHASLCADGKIREWPGSLTGFGCLAKRLRSRADYLSALRAEASPFPVTKTSGTQAVLCEHRARKLELR
jgi:Alpha-N-acetylglucosaminidase (NAGLU) N-terminal domain/Alpha-N-acetylglucosaminidase (NAGLU) tim-barrel domain